MLDLKDGTDPTLTNMMYDIQQAVDRCTCRSNRSGVYLPCYYQLLLAAVDLKWAYICATCMMICLITDLYVLVLV